MVMGKRRKKRIACRMKGALRRAARKVKKRRGGLRLAKCQKLLEEGYQ